MIVIVSILIKQMCNKILQYESKKGKQLDYHKCASCKPEYQKNHNHHCVKCCQLVIVMLVKTI